MIGYHGHMKHLATAVVAVLIAAGCGGGGAPTAPLDADTPASAEALAKRIADDFCDSASGGMTIQQAHTRWLGLVKIPADLHPKPGWVIDGTDNAAGVSGMISAKNDGTCETAYVAGQCVEYEFMQDSDACRVALALS